jgi:hypothetical protein
MPQGIRRAGANRQCGGARPHLILRAIRRSRIINKMDFMAGDRSQHRPAAPEHADGGGKRFASVREKPVAIRIML